MELGAGSGLVAICLAKIKAARVTITDGDSETLTNCSHNLAINGICIAEQQVQLALLKLLKDLASVKMHFKLTAY